MARKLRMIGEGVKPGIRHISCRRFVKSINQERPLCPPQAYLKTPGYPIRIFLFSGEPVNLDVKNFGYTFSH
jgi:hypothetical protein